MVECTNFPLDKEDCKRCPEYPCDIVRNRKMTEKICCKYIGRIFRQDCLDYPDKCKDCKHNKYYMYEYESSHYKYLKENKYHYYEQDVGL